VHIQKEFRRVADPAASAPVIIDGAFEVEARAAGKALEAWQRAVAEERAEIARREHEKLDRLRRRPITRYYAPHVPFKDRKGFPYLTQEWPERLRLAQERWDSLTPEQQQRETKEQHHKTMIALRWLQDHGDEL
jgi:hypothetical protein